MPSLWQGDIVEIVPCSSIQSIEMGQRSKQRGGGAKVDPHSLPDRQVDENIDPHSCQISRQESRLTLIAARQAGIGEQVDPHSCQIGRYMRAGWPSQLPDRQVGERVDPHMLLERQVGEQVDPHVCQIGRYRRAGWPSQLPDRQVQEQVDPHSCQIGRQRSRLTLIAAR